MVCLAVLIQIVTFQMLAGIGISQTILLNLLTLPASLRVHGITTLLEEATASEMYSSGITNSSSPGSSSSSGKRRGGEERGGVEGGRQAREGDRGVAKEGVAGEKGSESKRNSRSMDGVLQSLCCASGIDPDSPKSPTDADVRDCDPWLMISMLMLMLISTSPIPGYERDK